tara:strand:- start:1127 stop:1402 length:276 start_codon:yes stop_codon:yes gene_type:complete
MDNDIKKKIVKICIPNHIYPNRFDCLMYAFKLMKHNNNEIVYKDFKETRNHRVVLFDYDEKNLKLIKIKNGISIYYKNYLPENVPPLIEVK